MTVTQQPGEGLSDEAQEGTAGACAGLGGEMQAGQGYCWIPKELSFLPAACSAA